MGGGKPIIRVAFNHPGPPPANKIFKKFEEFSTTRKQGLRQAGGGKGIANWELGIANCKLRISGFQPEAVQRIV